MAKRLQQPPDATVILGRAQENRRNQPLAQVILQKRVDFLPLRLDILQQFLHQVIIEIRQLFQHGKAGGSLLLRHFRGQVDDAGRLPLLIDIGPLGREIDIAADDIVLENRHLAQHQRPLRHRLQRIEQLMDGTARLVHLVDKDKGRQLLLLQAFEQRRQRQNLRLIRFAHDHRCIHTLQGIFRFLEKFDRARTVEKIKIIAQIIDVTGIHLDAHLPFPRLAGAVAAGRPRRDTSLAIRLPADMKNGLKKCGFAARIGTHQRNAARPLWFVYDHDAPPFC